MNIQSLTPGATVELFVPNVTTEAWCWVNGRYVGYRHFQDAYIRPASMEVDVTSALKPGDNEIVFRVDTGLAGAEGLWSRPFLYEVAKWTQAFPVEMGSIEMTSRERVIAAVKFQGPDRVPVNLPEPWGSDFGGCGAGGDPDFTPCVKTETEWEDEFHTIWRKLHGDKTMGQPAVYPLTDYAMLDDFDWPDYTKDARYQGALAACANNPQDKFMLGGTPMSLIHRLEYLRGHQNAWTDAYEYPEQMTKLLNILGDIAIHSVDRLADAGADGIMSCDDWGLQDRPMLSPAIFAEFFKPVYKRVYHHAHERGMLTFLHSCGHITDLLEHFIEAELDVIQQDQQENMGVEELAARFGGRLCFWCPVDIQNTMVRGTVDDVRAYARKLIDNFGRFNGGFIAQWYASPQAVEHTDEKIQAMSAEFVEYGGKVYAGG